MTKTEIERFNEAAGIPRGRPTAQSKDRAVACCFNEALGGHPKPAIDGHLKTGHHT